MDYNNINAIKLVIDNLKKYGGKYIDNDGFEYGYLIGATETDSDIYIYIYIYIYYLYIKKDLSLCFSSAVGSFGKSYNKMINNDFSILDYLINNDSYNLFLRIKEKLKYYNDKLITPIHIGNKKYNIY